MTLCESYYAAREPMKSVAADARIRGCLQDASCYRLLEMRRAPLARGRRRYSAEGGLRASAPLQSLHEARVMLTVAADAHVLVAVFTGLVVVRR